MSIGSSKLWKCVLSFLRIFHLTNNNADYFPNNFLLGFSTSSYQIEGAWNQDGKGVNIWDQYTHTKPEVIADRSNADIACDSYHKYKEDVALLNGLGAQVYKFSLSWSRILPTGDIEDVNQAGIDYYNNLIDELLRNNIKPMITLYHWDLPQRLQHIGGWLNPLIADYFEAFARVAFKSFGDRVTLWTTFNDPLLFCVLGYGKAVGPPALNMTGTGEYLCMHNVLLSHARAFHMYDTDFRPSQKGKIGLICSGGYEPLSDSPADIEAAQRRMQFQIGWVVHPILRGNYPRVMRERIDANSQAEGRRRSRLPVFDHQTSDYVSGTLDFLGLNHHTTHLVSETTTPQGPDPSWDRDAGGEVTQNPSWKKTNLKMNAVVPCGFRKLLNWLKKEYDNFPLIVTENGYSGWNTRNDTDRIHFHTEYIREMLKAIAEDGCNVQGYLARSFMDSFEWIHGYTVKFGVYEVDFSSPERTRTPRASCQFFRKLYRTRSLSKALAELTT